MSIRANPLNKQSLKFCTMKELCGNCEFLPVVHIAHDARMKTQEGRGPSASCFKALKSCLLVCEKCCYVLIRPVCARAVSSTRCPSQRPFEVDAACKSCTNDAAPPISPNSAWLHLAECPWCARAVAVLCVGRHVHCQQWRSGICIRAGCPRGAMP